MGQRAKSLTTTLDTYVNDVELNKWKVGLSNGKINQYVSSEITLWLKKQENLKVQK